MNKKLFLSMFAATGMLFATSCSNDELEAVQSGNEAQVSFSLGLEGAIGSRAISDGTGADVLKYAVFDKDGNRLSNINAVEKTGVTFPTTAEITLAKGQTYKVAFWAQDDDCEAYTVSDDMKVTVDYKTNNTSNNDETRDAFFKTVEFTVTGSTSIDVELKRPFAQINVGVTKADWDAAVASGITIAQSSVVIKNAATSLNLLNGTVGEETADVSYVLNTIPNEFLEVDTDGNGEKEDYYWLSMSYILPADQTTGYKSTTLDNVSFEFAPSSGKPIKFNQGLNAVPVQRNWRTNILGKILTGDITFNIVIDPVYEDDHNVMVPYATINGVAYKSFAEAMAAVQDGETIKLEGETTLTANANEMLYTIENKDVTIDLNGYGIVANIPDVTKNTAIFQVKKNGTLTIQGEGYVKVVTAGAVNVLAALISNEGGTVNLNGGNWTMTALEYPDALIPTFVDNNSTLGASTLNINGGTYTFHRNLFRNFSNNKTEVATINIYGGIFNGRESDEGAIWNQKPSAGIPDGAGVINVMGGTFNNVVINDEFKGVVYVNNQKELVAALAEVNTHTINLGAGTYVADIYNGTPARKSLTIIGSEGTKFGHTATTGGQLRLDLFESFTIRNCEIIQRSGVKTWGHIVFGSGNKANGVYTIENCKFNGVGTQGIYINENTAGATYNILNCTFDGDFGNEGAITIQTNKDVNHIVNVKGCTFNNIPDTSHRIFLAKSTAGLFYDFTLNTDLQAYSAYDLAMYVALGKTNIDLADGEYDVYGCAGKTLTLNGSANAILKLYNDGEDGCDYAFGGNGTGVGNITFNGLTINTESNTGNYKGYAYMKGTFNECNFVGAYSLNNANDFVFNKCTFDFKNGYFWTWGANSVTFDGCTFNGNSKNILAHGYASTEITINDCTFAATEVGKTGAGDPTACVEIDPAGTNVYTINFTGTNTKTDKYAGWTRIKDNSTGHTITGVQ